ncbi:Hypothetical_protein [Hexamita inflata]|uniref:Hypothetical_protein n=1 Tax=Hexamita inflata TaxID=28002 RepID=A0AA86QF04_9EUKA|nr:Hypothetical protein HINF_LOCUS45110 [Hexamita inflata]
MQLYINYSISTSQTHRAELMYRKKVVQRGEKHSEIDVEKPSANRFASLADSDVQLKRTDNYGKIFDYLHEKGMMKVATQSPIKEVPAKSKQTFKYFKKFSQMLKPRYSLPQFRRSDLDQRVRSPHVGTYYSTMFRKLRTRLNLRHFQDLNFFKKFSYRKLKLQKSKIEANIINYYICRYKNIQNQFHSQLEIIRSYNKSQLQLNTKPISVSSHFKLIILLSSYFNFKNLIRRTVSKLVSNIPTGTLFTHNLTKENENHQNGQIFLYYNKQ